MKKITLFCFVALLSTIGFQASARPFAPILNDVALEIIDDQGHHFNRYAAHSNKRNERRYYLEAERGKNYALRLSNKTGKRLGVVIAVDGRNIINGKRSNLRPTESMYVLNPYETVNLKGWRTNGKHVHRFVFSAAEDSYAETTFNDTSAMGVIALAVFHEDMPVWIAKPRIQMERNRASGPVRKAAPSAMGDAMEDAGTGFGERAYSPVKRVEFKPRRRSSMKILVKYEWRETLCAKGVIDCHSEPRDPANRLWGNGGLYAPYPPGYWIK